MVGSSEAIFLLSFVSSPANFDESDIHVYIYISEAAFGHSSETRNSDPGVFIVEADADE